MPTKETIRLEAAFIGGDDLVLDFEGCITKHYIPRDHVQVGAGGDTTTSLMPGEYVMVTGLPEGTDFRAGWNRITCPSLGWREVTHDLSAEGSDAVRVMLKRRHPRAV